MTTKSIYNCLTEQERLLFNESLSILNITNPPCVTVKLTGDKQRDINEIFTKRHYLSIANILFNIAKMRADSIVKLCLTGK